MQIVFAPEALREFEQAWRYYEATQPGLGRRFKEVVHTGLKRIKAWPLAFAIEAGDVRRLLLPHFPYKLLYAVEKDHLYVVAVAHQHRHPEYWRDRRH